MAGPLMAEPGLGDLAWRYLLAALLPPLAHLLALVFIGALWAAPGTGLLSAPPLPAFEASRPLWAQPLPLGLLAARVLPLAAAIAATGWLARPGLPARHFVNLLSTGWAALFAALLAPIAALSALSGPADDFRRAQTTLAATVLLWLMSALPGALAAGVLWGRRNSVYNRIQD